MISSTSLVFAHWSALKMVTIRCVKVLIQNVRCVFGHHLTTLLLSGKHYLVIASKVIISVCGHTLIFMETGLLHGFVRLLVLLM